ncbi:hypothetical protein L218DRAFT_1004146 [Marasmius fiardii PR-910]|nr:hypothetical protein L218DRAFT_1004146 [Marasmius fiardii PR-910]
MGNAAISPPAQRKYWPSDILIPDNHTIPFYAGTNPLEWYGQLFNVTEAKLIADKVNPDLTGAPSNQTVNESSTTGTSIPPTTNTRVPPNITSSPSSASAQQETKPVGPIVGGVVGGVVFLALAVLLFICVRRRKRRAREIHRRSYLNSSSNHRPINPFVGHRVEPLPLPNDGSEKPTKNSTTRSKRVYVSAMAGPSSDGDVRENSAPVNETPTAPPEVGLFSDTASRLRDEVQYLRMEIEEMRLEATNDPPPEYS